MLLPVINIDVRDTTDQQFELALVEHVDKIRRNEFIEAGDKGIKLFLNALLNAPFRDEANSKLVDEDLNA